MTRTAIYKGIYFAVVALGAGTVVALIFFNRLSPVAILVVFAVLLVPGRILGWLWRDLLTGLRLLNAERFPESKQASERFLAMLRQRPWVRHAIWLGTSSYSRNPEVLALNNLGAAEVNLGEFDLAKRHLEQAIALDKKCPLPYFNMGALMGATDQPAEAERWFAYARDLGYAPGSVSDSIVKAAQSRFSWTDSRG